MSREVPRVRKSWGAMVEVAMRAVEVWAEVLEVAVWVVEVLEGVVAREVA